MKHLPRVSEICFGIPGVLPEHWNQRKLSFVSQMLIGDGERLFEYKRFISLVLNGYTGQSGFIGYNELSDEFVQKFARHCCPNRQPELLTIHELYAYGTLLNSVSWAYTGRGEWLDMFWSYSISAEVVPYALLRQTDWIQKLRNSYRTAGLEPPSYELIWKFLSNCWFVSIEEEWPLIFVPRVLKAGFIPAKPGPQDLDCMLTEIMLIPVISDIKVEDSAIIVNDKRITIPPIWGMPDLIWPVPYGYIFLWATDIRVEDEKTTVDYDSLAVMEPATAHLVCEDTFDDRCWIVAYKNLQI